MSYDELSSKEQAVVSAEWSETVDARLDQLDLAEELAAQGRSYTELDANGRVVQHDPA